MTRVDGTVGVVVVLGYAASASYGRLEVIEGCVGSVKMARYPRHPFINETAVLLFVFNQVTIKDNPSYNTARRPTVNGPRGAFQMMYQTPSISRCTSIAESSTYNSQQTSPTGSLLDLTTTLKNPTITNHQPTPNSITNFGCPRVTLREQGNLPSRFSSNDNFNQTVASTSKPRKGILQDGTF